VPYGVAFPLSPAAAAVSLATSMPINRAGWSTTRLLCRRLHTGPSGATRDHCTWRDGSPLQGGHGSSGGGSSGRCRKHRQAGSKGRRPVVRMHASHDAGRGRSPGLTSLPGFSGPETDMRSIVPAIRRQHCQHAGAPAGSSAEAATGPHTPATVERRGRPQRWRDAVNELLAIQATYANWLAALPDGPRGNSIAEALEAIVDLELTALAEIKPPRGCGRDWQRQPKERCQSALFGKSPADLTQSVHHCLTPTASPRHDQNRPKRRHHPGRHQIGMVAAFGLE
jgi:hypothetical protein